MELEELKVAVKRLPPEERRKLALYILDLEKDHFKEKVGPQIQEDLDGLSKVVQEAVDRIKKVVKERL